MKLSAIYHDTSSEFHVCSLPKFPNQVIIEAWQGAQTIHSASLLAAGTGRQEEAAIL